MAFEYWVLQQNCATLRITGSWFWSRGDIPHMTFLANTPERDRAHGRPRFELTRNRAIYLACLSFFFVGTLARIVMDHYWRWVSPRAIDVLAGRTYELNYRNGAVFITPFEGHLLECLNIAPSVFLIIGMLVWARAWREWK